MHKGLALLGATLGMLANIYADVPRGSYRLSYNTDTIITGSNNHPLPSCGDDARRTLLQHRTLVVVYDAGVRVNGESWNLISVTRDQVAESDVAVAMKSVRDSPLSMRLGIWRKDGKARGVLIVYKPNSEGALVCADSAGYVG